jgi:sec-independent protein translocase protein TatA
MSIGFWQLVVILVIILLLFGAGRVPQIASDLAKGLKVFKANLKDDKKEDKKETKKKAKK